MRIRLEVKTPPGQATGTEQKLRLFILGKLKKPATTYTSPDDSLFYWELDVSVKDYLRIGRNCTLFSSGMASALDKKLVRQSLTHLADKAEDLETLRQFLVEGTQLRVIKEATAAEIVEGNKTFWQRVKDSFKRAEVRG